MPVERAARVIEYAIKSSWGCLSQRWDSELSRDASQSDPERPLADGRYRVGFQLPGVNRID